MKNCLTCDHCVVSLRRNGHDIDAKVFTDNNIVKVYCRNNLWITNSKMPTTNLSTISLLSAANGALGAMFARDCSEYVTEDDDE